jgi:hypothetical protein
LFKLCATKKALAERYLKHVKHVTPDTMMFAKDAAEMITSAANGANASSSAALAAIGWAGDALERAAPALLFVAPVALALGALLRQYETMASNKPLVEELHETAEAMWPVLCEVTRNDAVATNHEPTLRGLTQRLQAANTLIARIGARSWCASFFHAGSDGAELAAVTAQVHQWVGLLTAAVAAGAEGRLVKQVAAVRSALRADVRKLLEAERAALAAAVRDGAVPPALAPLPPASDAEVAAWRDQVAARLTALGVDASAAEQLARDEAARGVERHNALLVKVRAVLAGVDGGVARLDAAIAVAAAEAAARDAATKEAVDAVATKVEGVGASVADLTQLVHALRSEVAAAYAAARAAGGSVANAQEASRRTAARAAARLLLSRVPSLPPERLVVWDDVVLGTGSFGVVHPGLLLPVPGTAAFGRGKPTLVAVKRLAAAGTGAVPPDPAVVARFVSEVRLQAALAVRHPGVVGVYGLCERCTPGGTETLLVSELMAAPLEAVLHGDSAVGGVALELADCLALLRDVAGVLAALHSGADGVRVTHADVKSVRR